MIQMLINLGKWLENRFPKQVLLTEVNYIALLGRISQLESVLPMVERIATIEQNAVHKEPVKLLVEEMAKMKAELTSLRAGLGITASASSPEAMETMLNGAFISQGDTHNG